MSDRQKYVPKVGRPSTETARIYFGDKNSQLWLSKGALELMGHPHKIAIAVDDKKLILREVDEDDETGLSVSANGFVSASGFMNFFEIAEEDVPERYSVRKSDNGSVVLEPIVIELPKEI